MDQKHDLEAWLIRGLPGTGKSHLAEKLRASIQYSSIGTCHIHTTDNYHMVKGQYVYNTEKASEYHQKNLEAFTHSCEGRIPLVICANTNINSAQYRAYEEAAKANGYKVFRVIMDEFDLDVCKLRNTHGVPDEVLQRMANTFEIENLIFDLNN